MFLALFPLQLVIFPGQELPLHIFEPRYKQLIVECRDEGIAFGIPTYLNNSLSKFGTEVELSKVIKTYDNGEMDILVRGKRVFEIHEYQPEVPGKLYSGAEVNYREADYEADPSTTEAILDNVRNIETLLRQNILPNRTFENESLAYYLAPRLPLSLAQRVEVLAMPSEAERQTFILKATRRTLDSLRKRSEERKKIAGNGAGKSHP